MPEKFFTKQLPNGLTLLGQHMEQVSSAVMTLMTPGGASHDAEAHAGAAAVAAEWHLRGAGNRDTRQLNDALDALGCQHHENVTSQHVCFSAAQLGRHLPDVMAIYADILLRPRLDDTTFDPCRSLVMQDLHAMEDEPAQKCNMLLRENFFPYPLGRCVDGHAKTLAALTADDVRQHVAQTFSPQGTILAVAGNIDWSAFCDAAERHFGDWDAPAPPTVKVAPAKGGFTHVKKDSAQAHIALAHAAAPLSDPGYYAARVAAMVLSGGMASRLFTEVREKRGLVYHVSSRYQSLKGHAGMFTYAGTTPQRAQETFDVTVGELQRLADGVTDEEMDRARTQSKSTLVMQAESTAARSSAIAADWYHLGRLRSLDEIAAAIDAVTADDVIAYLKQYPAENFTVLVIGPDPIEINGKTS